MIKTNKPTQKTNLKQNTFQNKTEWTLYEKSKMTDSNRLSIVWFVKKKKSSSEKKMYVVQWGGAVWQPWKF